MPMIGAETVAGLLESYRMCHVMGRFSGGKTSWAFAMSEHFLRRGYKLVTNCRNVWASDLKDVDFDSQGHLNAFVVIDEGGLYFQDSFVLKVVVSYAAKMGLIFVIPSFIAPARVAQVVTVQPLFNFKGIGLPLIVYKWRVKLNAQSDSGTFIWSNPSYIYGTYSRQDPGDRADSIINWVIEKKDAYRKRFGYDDSPNALSDLDSQQTQSSHAMQDAADTIAQAADDWASIPVSRRGCHR